MAGKTKSKKHNTPMPEEKPNQPYVIFLDERANKPVSLITLGVLAVIMGFLSKTPLMAKTILSAPADIMLIFGVIGIIAGLMMNYRRKHPLDDQKSKKM